MKNDKQQLKDLKINIAALEQDINTYTSRMTGSTSEADYKKNKLIVQGLYRTRKSIVERFNALKRLLGQ